MAKIDVKQILSIGGSVATALSKAADDPKVSLEQKDVPKVQTAVENALKDDIKNVQAEVDARLDHLQNTEDHIWQKRTFWSYVVSGVFVVVGPLLVRYGIDIDEGTKEMIIQTATTLGGVVAGIFAWRAGVATKPLGK